MATEIESLLDYVVNVGGTELLVTEGAPSAVRLAGKVCSIPDAPAVEPGALREFLGSIEGESGSIIGGPWANARWRVRYFRSALGTSAVFRPLMEECPGFGDLGAPQTLNNLLGLSSGLVVFAGPACAGKTTTATSYVSALCESRMMRVCFLDAAGEYSVRTGECLVLANSSGSSSDKMAQALRCGCDLFWMGDFEGENLLSMLRAAESGALVVCTITAGNAVGAVEALLSGVAPEDRALARTMLASVFKAVVVQRLLPGATEGAATVPAWEILYNTQNVSTFIRNGDHFKLPSVIAASSSEGMLLMDDCLAELVRGGYVSREEAGKYVSNIARLG
ncbi:ATPase, T2SS/T4P/T4SS family [uncultured Fibrobacter sp.]|uniref:ATPase, T2SS/T4P/T4SS family n=1 Tax=uncultured Fibrobacter sp. TaxID=261512 RepID=UPI0025DBC6B4|nr:ATPase, T2SS/T4P/T4SS family [uncultured Fibrobacter sp.]